MSFSHEVIENIGVINKNQNQIVKTRIVRINGAYRVDCRVANVRIINESFTKAGLNLTGDQIEKLIGMLRAALDKLRFYEMLQNPGAAGVDDSGADSDMGNPEHEVFTDPASPFYVGNKLKSRTQ
jgi:hypothetical protein